MYCRIIRKVLRTTNPNESFNTQIWRRAPKHLPVNKNTVSTVVFMAVLEFNKGANGLSDVFSMLDMTLHYMQHHPPGSDTWMQHGMQMKPPRRRD